MNKHNIKYEFFEFTRNTEIELDNPAEIEIINVGAPGQNAFINNIFELTTLTDFQLGVLPIVLTPYSLKLKNNINELDTTKYKVEIIITCRYSRFEYYNLKLPWLHEGNCV